MTKNMHAQTVLRSSKHMCTHKLANMLPTALLPLQLLALFRCYHCFCICSLRCSICSFFHFSAARNETGDRSYVFHASSIYERDRWISSIAEIQVKCKRQQHMKCSSCLSIAYNIVFCCCSCSHHTHDTRLCVRCVMWLLYPVHHMTAIAAPTLALPDLTAQSNSDNKSANNCHYCSKAFGLLRKQVTNMCSGGRWQ